MIKFDATHRKRFPIIWLTGNTGAGKSTLAFAMREYFNEEAPTDSPIARRVIVLDGDEMRDVISREEGLSAVDRRQHNLRVARLADLLSRHGFFVIVSVIAPFVTVRKEIDGICKPQWIYVKRGGLSSGDRPYEEPTSAHLVIDIDTVDEDTAVYMLRKCIEESVL
ncbi:MAG TPA: adenylyl-sulfate kinase [Candidatus Peribacterales bacterium]|nr:adenylyl-sulfate kinase [Candidatus Peribacterales bacterium]